MDVTNNESLAAHIRSLCRKLDSEQNKGINENIKSYIIVDLGNVHDFLPHVDAHPSDFSNYNIVAFADHHFNGYGVNPRCSSNVSLRVSGSTRNAADVAMIWFVARLTVSSKSTFIFLTKDKGFSEISSLCLECDSEAFFFPDTASFLASLRVSD